MKALVLGLLIGCGAGRDMDRTTECLCKGDAAPPSDAACDESYVTVYPKPGCLGAVAPVCVDPADTGCVTIYCGCDDKVHVDGCEGARTPYKYKAGDGPDLGTEAGAPCGRSDASSD